MRVDDEGAAQDACAGRIRSLIRAAAKESAWPNRPRLIPRRFGGTSRSLVREPISDPALLLWHVLVDHLIGTAEQVGSDGDAESLCGLEIDEQLNFRGLLNR